MFNRILNYWKEISLVVLMGLCLTVPYLDHKANNFNPTHPDVVTINVNGGGEVMKFYEDYTQMRIDHKKLRIEGLCASACTFFLGLIPHDDVCATPQSRFGFHGIYTLFLTEKVPNFEMYKWFMPLVYPDWLLEKLRNKYGYDGSKADVDNDKYPGGVIWIDRDELNIQHCED